MKIVTSLSFAILSLFACASCKKADEVNPDVASEVTGTYQVQYLYGSGKAMTLPNATTQAGITLSRISNTDVNLILGVTIGNAQQVSQPVTYQVKRDGTKYEVDQNSRKVGTIESNTLKMDIISTDGSTRYVEAIRR